MFDNLTFVTMCVWFLIKLLRKSPKMKIIHGIKHLFLGYYKCVVGNYIGVFIKKTYFIRLIYFVIIDLK